MSRRFGRSHLLSVKAVREIMRYQTHVLANLDDKSVGYVISESALRTMTPKEIDREIVPQIARQLVAALKNPQ